MLYGRCWFIYFFGLHTHKHKLFYIRQRRALFFQWENICFLSSFLIFYVAQCNLYSNSNANCWIMCAAADTEHLPNRNKFVFFLFPFRFSSAVCFNERKERISYKMNKNDERNVRNDASKWFIMTAVNKFKNYFLIWSCWICVIIAVIVVFVFLFPSFHFISFRFHFKDELEWIACEFVAQTN